MSSREYIKSRILNWIRPLENDHPPLYLVGGAVRDYLLGRTNIDFDLVCRQARQVARDLSKIWKTKMVAFEKQNRSSCYRVVDPFHPGVFLDITPMQGCGLENDLKLRDFTINSLAMEVSGQGFGQVIDPLGGRHDLENKLVRMNAEKSLLSDPLRILRAFRFSAQLSFSIEVQTKKALMQHACLLQQSASERVSSELLLLLESEHSYDVLLNMDDLGVLGILLPEIVDMKGCAQNYYHHLGVWEHSLAVYNNCEIIVNHLQQFFSEHSQAVYKYLVQQSRLPLLKLAALLHDIGKPCSKAINKDKRITFYGHDKLGADLIVNIGERLKMSRQKIGFMSLLVEEHLHVRDLSQSEVKPSTRMKFFRKAGDDCLAIFILAIADIQATSGQNADFTLQKQQIKWCRDMVHEYLTHIKGQIEQRDLITGNDLLQIGLKQGPRLGRILKEVKRATDDGEISTKAEALRWVGRHYLLNSQ